MKKLFLTATAIITVIVAVFPFWSGLTPTVRAEPINVDWQLSIIGLVNQPLNLSLTDIAAMPKTSVYATIYCVDFPNSVVTEGNWTGVNLWFLLETAGVSSDAVKVAFFASDGFSTDLPIETAMREDIILAYEKDGAGLSEKLRLVVPGKWGYKWINQVTSIEVVDYDFRGFWESRGYSDTADRTEGGLIQPKPVYPDSSGTIPEFSSVLAILVPLVLLIFVALVLKKRGSLEKPF